MIKKGVILDRYSFDTLIKGRYTTVYNRCGTIKYIPGSGKIATVISSKQEKRAVYRNKAKRRVKNLFLQSKKDVDCIFYPAKTLFSFQYVEFKEIFSDLLKKIK